MSEGYIGVIKTKDPLLKLFIYSFSRLLTGGVAIQFSEVEWLNQICFSNEIEFKATTTYDTGKGQIYFELWMKNLNTGVMNSIKVFSYEDAMMNAEELLSDTAFDTKRAPVSSNIVDKLLILSRNSLIDTDTVHAASVLLDEINITDVKLSFDELRMIRVFVDGDVNNNSYIQEKKLAYEINHDVEKGEGDSAGFNYLLYLILKSLDFDLSGC